MRSELLAPGVMFVGLCLFYVLYSIYATWKIRSRRWIEVKAQILQLKVPAELHQGLGASNSRFGHDVQLRYEYEFSGTRYVRSNITIADKAFGAPSHIELLRSLHRDFERGQPIAVFVNADKPWEAVVSREISYAGPRVLGISAIGIAVLLFLNFG